MRKLIIIFVALAILALPAGALADDHLFNAAHSNGVDARGFGNPVAGNPSGIAAGHSLPALVPGLGDPKVGHETGTPAFEADVLCKRLEVKTGDARAAFCSS